jgi:hypothetical protein
MCFRLACPEFCALIVGEFSNEANRPNRASSPLPGPILNVLVGSRPLGSDLVLEQLPDTR